MPSYRSIAANVAQHKEKHPELYCPERRCLWRTGDGSPCPRHSRLRLYATARKENDQ